MEESVAQGKVLNNEQREVLRSKPSVSATIDELEKLRQPLSVSVSEEIKLAIERHRTESQPSPGVPAAAADVAAAKEEKNGETERREEEEGSQPTTTQSTHPPPPSSPPGRIITTSSDSHCSTNPPFSTPLQALSFDARRLSLLHHSHRHRLPSLRSPLVSGASSGSGQYFGISPRFQSMADNPILLSDEDADDPSTPIPPLSKRLRAARAELGLDPAPTIFLIDDDPSPFKPSSNSSSAPLSSRKLRCLIWPPLGDARWTFRLQKLGFLISASSTKIPYESEFLICSLCCTRNPDV
ncbi:unnamed protein product [Linum trigynum]|uniref:Uncharacterized protein n=1 Tax=Linum trigynum TaxID=586398 RepID=A0AAV2F088_9ROSI